MANAFTAGGTDPEEEEKTVDENEEERCEICKGSLEIRQVFHATCWMTGFPTEEEITEICEACPEGRDLADEIYDAMFDDHDEVCGCCLQGHRVCKCEYP